jgi:Fur family ferric uptake transcriptional regulator
MERSIVSNPSPALALHEAGYRFTAQRRKVLDVLRDSHDHPTAEDIYTRLRRRGERVCIGTIYRTVELLEKIGLVTKINLGNRNRYELVENPTEMKHHYHLVCEKCGRIMDISEDILAAHAKSLEELVTEVGDVSGFQVSGHQFRIFGVCRNCR